jgi:ubiquinone/menaquinone biosynthesis C-methylase UbiE
MPEPYKKDMSHVTWQQVFARQEKRAPLVAEWLDGLQLKRGDRVLDIGAGPGYISLRAAERVGPEGLVIAVDRSAEALAYLERLQAERGVGHIKRIVADATGMEPPGEPLGGALVTMMLHHADDPAQLLKHVASLLPARARAVVAEFHPDGPCEVGPPRDHRIPPAEAEGWCRAAGLIPITFRRQTEEHYMLVLERGSCGTIEGRS